MSHLTLAANACKVYRVYSKNDNLYTFEVALFNRIAVSKCK